jgi:3-hydroxymyristoyl/3-hydroxydecanoyl-(acyl carrier protein) dehydratase
MNPVAFDFCVAADHPTLPGHFPQQPIVPGVLLLDHVLSALQRATGRRVTGARQVKFTSALRPQELAHAGCEVDGETASFRVTAQRGDITVTIASGRLTLAPADENTA